MSTVAKEMAKRTFSKMDAVGLGLSAYFGYQDYKDYRAQGQGFFGAAAGAIGTTIISEAMHPALYLGMQALGAVPSLATNAVLGLQQYGRQMHRNKNTPFSTSTFVDTKQAYTMRQAGMQLAENSKYNLQQSLLGNEASMLHI